VKDELKTNPGPTTPKPFLFNFDDDGTELQCDDGVLEWFRADSERRLKVGRVWDKKILDDIRAQAKKEEDAAKGGKKNKKNEGKGANSTNGKHNELLRKAAIDGQEWYRREIKKQLKNPEQRDLLNSQKDKNTMRFEDLGAAREKVIRPCDIQEWLLKNSHTPGYRELGDNWMLRAFKPTYLNSNQTQSHARDD